MRLWLLVLAASVLWGQDSTESRSALNQGVQAFRSARYAEAVQAFQRAVDLDPASLNARLYLATAYFQQYIPGNDSPENHQMAARAQEGFAQVLALDASNAVAMNSLAALCLSQKRWEEARGWFQRILAINPNNPEAYYSLGFIAWSEWYPADSQARQNAGMRLDDPGPIANASVRQDLQRRFGSVLEGGIADLQRALDIHPQYDDAMSYLNLLLRGRADLRDTKEDWQKDTVEADQWMQKALETKRQREQVAAAPAGTAPARIRFSGAVQQAKLIRRVDPVYPAQARQEQIQGTVRVSLVISKDGTVQNVSAVSGHPLLIPAAMEAVKQWVYQPTLLNGNPTEVVTEVDVAFTLDPPATAPK